MEKVDIVIIGAGVVGLAIADALSHDSHSIVLLERNESFGRETSSRNSEVIHAGIYYAAGSLKAELCVEGCRMLYGLCERVGIPHARLGKIVPGIEPEEVAEVVRRFESGCTNGAPGLRMLSSAEAERMEPTLRCREALFSPHTGIVDSHRLMAHLELQSTSRGVVCAYNCTVVGVHRAQSSYVVDVRDADAGHTELSASIVINSAGLSCDKIAGLAGIDIDAAGYRLSYAKGEYFKGPSASRGMFNHLIYPAGACVPLGAVSRGVHNVVSLDRSWKIGPNILYVDEIDYTVDPRHGEEFCREIQRYLPFVNARDLSPDMAGVRPMLQREEESFADFIIVDEGSRGLPGLIDLIGIESPGLTSCLAIGRKVRDLVRTA